MAVLRLLHWAAGVYECDDKCGSYWQALPVDPTGREGKSVAHDLYRFSIQANVICGQSGFIRFAFLPKHVATGGNFGLTNLMMGLSRAYNLGRIGPQVKTLYRHHSPPHPLTLQSLAMHLATRARSP